VAVTGKVTAGERKRCLDAGADAYLPKPVDPAEMFSVLRPWLPPPPDPVVLDGVLSGLKVMVVDDDFRNIFAMTALLERANATVTAAESGADAVASLLRDPHIDVVLMDIMMPTMDGYDTIRAIRRISGFDVLPIVAVTGKAASGERERCLAAGADDYLAKPVDTAALLAVLAPLVTPRATMVAG
jgi:CheY-like chemotaxis protein